MYKIRASIDLLPFTCAPIWVWAYYLHVIVILYIEGIKKLKKKIRAMKGQICILSWSWFE